MHKPRMLSAVVVAALALALVSPGVAQSAPTQPGRQSLDERPNIVLISSDDQTDLELRWMPLTRRLLGEAGVNFTDGLNPHPLCCPARAEILTGEYGHNNGVHNNLGPWGGYDAFIAGGNLNDNIATWMQGAGYQTAFIGKPMNGTEADSPRMGGWDYYSPTVFNTYAYYGTTFQDDLHGQPRTYDDQYVADVVRDQTLAKVADFSAAGKPFFIWASHVGPHGAINEGEYVEGPSGQRLSTRVSGKAAPVPAVRHDNVFDHLALPTKRKPSFTETGDQVLDKPTPVARQSFPRNDVEELFQRRVESLQAIDEANAATINALAAAGELDNTVVVYVSDNGYQLGEHGLEGKNWVYHENLQIPFLMRGPGVAPGQSLPMAATVVDLAPTFLDYAGALRTVRRTGRTDGLSLRGALRHGMPNDTSLIQAGANDRPWWWRGVRTTRYTWARWSQGYFEFYDRRADPYELTNLLDPDTGELLKPRYANVLGELRSRYRFLRDCDGVAQCEGGDFGLLPAARR